MSKLLLTLCTSVAFMASNAVVAQENGSSLTETKVAAHGDHSVFDGLLAKHVKPIDGSSQVDYDGFAADRSILKTYIASLAKVSRPEFDAWPLDHQLAFLINAYNANTIELILTRYPDIKSIRNIKSPWKQKFVSLFGDKVSLDNIEHDMIRGSDRYNDPRIHFAVNCASIGCPPLLNAAFVGEKLEKQLEDSTRKFLNDQSRNYWDGDVLYVSNIFKWYRKDFGKGWRGAQNLSHFLSLYPEALNLNDAQQSALRNGRVRIKHTSYDWKLNKAPRSD